MQQDVLTQNLNKDAYLQIVSLYLFLNNRNTAIGIDNLDELCEGLVDAIAESGVDDVKETLIPTVLKMMFEFCGYKTIDFAAADDVVNFNSHVYATEILKNMALESIEWQTKIFNHNSH